MSELDLLLETLSNRRGSDLFLTVDAPPMIKVDGTLQPLDRHPLSSAAVDALLAAALGSDRYAAFQAQQEANFALIRDEEHRYRVSAFMQRGEPGLVIRRIETQIPTLEDLHLPPVLRDLSEARRGLVLFVGGTGTGKSTSLAAMVGHRNDTAPGHILTVEDPVEFVHDHRQCLVTQREVGLDTESFGIALRNALRQAPDVLLIGEIRSREVMEHAIAFAETGHLVLATLHANNAAQTLDRILGFFHTDEHHQVLLNLSLNLKAILAQQLLPRCDRAGRVPALEVLIGTPLVQDKIRRGEIHAIKEIMQRSAQHGMQTFDRHLYELHAGGQISREHALAHADSANEVRLMIDLGGPENVQGSAAAEPGANAAADDRPAGRDDGNLRLRDD